MEGDRLSSRPLPVAAIGYALTIAAWCGSLAMLLLPLYVDALPGDSAKFYVFEVTQALVPWPRRRSVSSDSSLSHRGSPLA